MIVTIKDIAKHSGVSYHSVSKVLNNRKSFVGKETRERILAAAKKLNYRPNFMASALRKGKSYCIGMACVGNLGELSNLDANRFCAGAGSLAEEKGYFMSLLPMGNLQFEEKLIAAARSRMVDGIIVLVYSQSFDRFSQVTAPLLQAENFPFVAIHETARKTDFHAVGLDSVKAGRLAAAHLLAQGYRRINILFNPALHSHVEFYAGYSQALREAGVDPAQGKMASEGATPAQGYEAGKRVVAAGEPAEGYIIFSDAVASGFVRALNEAGVRVPQDVAVVGGENILKEELYYSPLSAVDRKYEERGQQAAEMLIQAIEKGAGLRPEIQNRILEPALVIRASSQRSNTK